GYCAECRNKRNDIQRVKRADCRRQALEHYSNGLLECACCGETEYGFLTLDHPNNDGNIERKEITDKSMGMSWWAIKQNFKPELQVLCMNCNWGRMMNDGKWCPHQAPISLSEVIASAR